MTTIREMQIKNARRNHPTPVSMAICKWSVYRQQIRGRMQQRESSNQVVVNVNWVSATLQNSVEVH